MQGGMLGAASAALEALGGSKRLKALESASSRRQHVLVCTAREPRLRPAAGGRLSTMGVE
jgi:hypothetical protein